MQHGLDRHRLLEARAEHAELKLRRARSKIEPGETGQAVGHDGMPANADPAHAAAALHGGPGRQGHGRDGTSPNPLAMGKESVPLPIEANVHLAHACNYRIDGHVR